MHAGDFKNIGPKQTQANQSYTTQLSGQRYATALGDCARNTISLTNTHVLSQSAAWPAVIHPPCLIA